MRNQLPRHLYNSFALEPPPSLNSCNPPPPKSFVCALASPMSLSKQEALRLAKASISENVTCVKNISTIARLWGGMGQVYRVVCDTSGGEEQFCIKYMVPRLSSRNNVSLGDQRKLDSYVVEAAFYSEYSAELRSKGVGLAECLLVEQEDNHKTILCLSLLQNAPNDDYYKHTLEWLAHFHANTWQRDASSLQEVGTYWHLGTRPNEWQSMSSKGWEGRLKLAAPAIDEFLSSTTDIICWVHGDAKDANVMWDGEKVAMCDFQYVGRGCPAKDLAYFLCSNNVADDDEYVDMYYEMLCSKLDEAPSRIKFDDALELSYCDYLRFMCGWGQWGSDITDRVKRTLDKIDGGKKLASEDAYREAVQEVFG